MTKKDPLIHPSVLVCKGRTEEAIYQDPIIPSYQNNPLIEALPNIWDQQQVSELLARYPEYKEEHRQLPAHLRLHLIQDALQLFTPLPIHFDLE
jgi:hypothetical protein